MACQIEDPFEQPENTARAVSSRQLKRISEAFEVTHHRLISYSLNQTAVLAALVRPHEVQFLTQIPVRNGSYNGGRLDAMPWNQRALNSPSQMQHQHQRMKNSHQGPAHSFARNSAVPKPHHHPSNDSIPQKSTQQHPNKPQQKWRPRSSKVIVDEWRVSSWMRELEQLSRGLPRGFWFALATFVLLSSECDGIPRAKDC